MNQQTVKLPAIRLVAKSLGPYDFRGISCSASEHIQLVLQYAQEPVDGKSTEAKWVDVPVVFE